MTTTIRKTAADIEPGDTMILIGGGERRVVSIDEYVPSDTPEARALFDYLKPIGIARFSNGAGVTLVPGSWWEVVR